MTRRGCPGKVRDRCARNRVRARCPDRSGADCAAAGLACQISASARAAPDSVSDLPRACRRAAPCSAAARRCAGAKERAPSAAAVRCGGCLGRRGRAQATASNAMTSARSGSILPGNGHGGRGPVVRLRAGRRCNEKPPQRAVRGRCLLQRANDGPFPRRFRGPVTTPARAPHGPAPDPALPRSAPAPKAKPVTRFDAALSRLVDDMFDTMYAAPGIGLCRHAGQRAVAAGRHRRLMKRPIRAFREPEILESRGEEEMDGPPVGAGLLRDRAPRRLVRVHASTATVSPSSGDRRSPLAACIQHEINHLDGKLFVDLPVLAEARPHPAPAEKPALAHDALTRPAPSHPARRRPPVAPSTFSPAGLRVLHPSPSHRCSPARRDSPCPVWTRCLSCEVSPSHQPTAGRAYSKRWPRVQSNGARSPPASECASRARCDAEGAGRAGRPRTR